MKKNLYSLSAVAMTMLALSGAALAEGTNLDVNFTANIRETTCDMKLVGGEGSDTQQTLKIGGGQVRLDDVKAGTANANFKIVIVECPASLTSLKTTVSGTRSGYLFSGLVNSILKTAGGADYSAVEIARASTPDAPFIINSKDDSERLVWTPTEIQNKEVQLVATLRETKANSMTVGDFQAVATFEFSYE
ncbi:fimbrial protein [Enterobacter cloacae complex sp. IR53043]|uniref:Fimbrial protein n=3 Tax=Enterobacter cloacae complex TaxID=354276 RepID=A0AAE7YZ63_9ENTR|nr:MULTISPECIES: fimbrial protein [Enterobacter]AVO82467.1 fimbrial protein [Enterobacter cloacae complex sp.]EIM37570.1 putative fimbrial protein StkD [Enterobacter cloacae subsp. cloacae GS1]MBH4408650.1 fimbrial protein [Pseudomonas aeruginosa]AJB80543.1 fimbrial protein [Enterobacter hormaechei subsp. xiangfangensis]ATW94489.1 fimbrial protein [Enterobacter sp. CRENT-193]